MKKDKTLYIVIPCYNEEEVLEETTKQLKKKMESLIKAKKISNKSKVMYVNDGSKDNTWNIIKEINEKEKMRKDTETFVIEVLKKVPKGVARERVLELTGLAAVMTAAQAKYQSNSSAVT